MNRRSHTYDSQFTVCDSYNNAINSESHNNMQRFTKHSFKGSHLLVARQHLVVHETTITHSQPWFT